jgi:aldehyde dehydrogenase (NAD+)
LVTTLFSVVRTQDKKDSVETVKAHSASRMLIDGERLSRPTRRRHSRTSIRPPEEVLGPVADGSIEDMRRAIAARRAFDKTEWSTHRVLRKHRWEQRQEALNLEVKWRAWPGG